MTTVYPRIEKMMAGYINMDAYEMTGFKDRADQVRYYTSRVSPKALKHLLQELDSFEHLHGDDLTETFEDEFDFGAHIPDAKAFFNLVRHEVNAALGQQDTAHTMDASILPVAQPEVEIPSGTNLKFSAGTDRWLMTQFRHKSDEGEALRRSIHETLLQGPHETGIWGEMHPSESQTQIISWEELSNTEHSVPLGIVSKVSHGSFLKYFELFLLNKAQSTPANERLTKDYVETLEKLLELKGVKVERPEPETVSRSFNLSVEEFLQMQEGKTTR